MTVSHERFRTPSPGRRKADGFVTWAARLSERLAGAFVGREAELALFRQALEAAEPSFQVLAITGGPGSGKTTLLRRFSAECRRHGIECRLLDAGRIQPVPDAVLQALRAALCLDDDDSLTSALAGRGRCILLIDNYDALAPLHDWLCETVLPGFPAGTVLVVAGRAPLPEPWRTDPAWRELVRPVTLRDFSPDEARAYLDRRAVPGDAHEHLLRRSHGHPLALSLAVDLCQDRSGYSFDPLSDPDVVQTLVRRFVGDVADPGLRAALEAAAIVRVTTEPVIAAMLEKDDVRAEFERLCELSFINFAPGGVYPHDLVRETLSRDLGWRNPARFENLRRRAGDFYTPLLHHPDPDVQEEALADYLFLYRNHQALKPLLEFPLLPKTVPAAEADYPRMLALVRHYEGEESARTLEHWLRHRPDGARVIRGEDGELRALAFIVRLDRSSEEYVRADPITRRLWDYLQENNLLGPGDVATVSRFTINAETNQRITPNLASMAVSLLRDCLTVPNLKFTFSVVAEPERWEPMALAAGFFKPLRDLKLCSGERPVGVFVRDWRYESPAAWLERIVPKRQRHDDNRKNETPHAGATPIQDEQEFLKRRDEFVKAVRHALKHFHVPDMLAKNPLLNSALVTGRTGAKADSDSKVRSLQAVIAEVVKFLGTVPKRVPLYQALRYTYLEPKGSQERVAEWLDLPFSTYRGHLRAGIEVLTDVLWRKDVEARG